MIRKPYYQPGRDFRVFDGRSAGWYNPSTVRFFTYRCAGGTFMDPVTYLTTVTTDFGALEWVFFIVQIALAVAGVYLTFLRAEPHPIRRIVSRNFGYALLSLGALGIVLGALRLAPVALFTMPIW